MTKDIRFELARLEQVLDTFGAEPSRWPEPERCSLEHILKTQPAARQLHAEASALARVMDAVPAISASDALKARIVAAAVTDPVRDARVVPITASPASLARHGKSSGVSTIWPAAALAASFAFGLYLGVAGIGGQAFQGAFQVSGLGGNPSDAEGITWLDDGAEPDAGDVL
jgi:hypothetical protein